MSEIFKGSCVALITPFNEDGIDFNQVRKLIDFQIENNTSAILVLGTTGEPPTMTADEKRALIDFSVKYVNGRVPVIVGAGGNNTANVISDSLYAQNAGADALLLITPYYNKATQNGLVQHFYAIADSVDIPAIVYNVPARTGINLKAETLDKLLLHKNISGIKEASANIEQICEMAAICRRHNKHFYSGDDAITYVTLSLGGKGVISVAANIIPKEMSDICSLYFDGQTDEALKLHERLLDLAKNLFLEVNPIPVKTAARLLGLIEDARLRLPLTDMEEENVQKLKKSMESFGLDIVN